MQAATAQTVDQAAAAVINQLRLPWVAREHPAKATMVVEAIRLPHMGLAAAADRLPLAKLRPVTLNRALAGPVYHLQLRGRLLITAAAAVVVSLLVAVFRALVGLAVAALAALLAMLETLEQLIQAAAAARLGHQEPPGVPEDLVLLSSLCQQQITPELQQVLRQ